ncbi:efflux RND transporter periplasmic adaptor subunit [Algibacillus agarilyticus]|uniref:efflux RND transporter periplasmic adaptor subunit n=1 Tax=Algibacillus agarilyticus TaxID=2234133 RepID=UPI000DD0C389|nr:efflux RND transporter periplasmic adaptor subunit [Algibacillus agarilyticus]
MKDSFPLVLITLFSLFIAMYWLTDSQGDELVVPKTPQINVIASPIKLQDYTPVIESYGRVQARSQGNVVSQVGGEVTFVSANLRAGGFFAKGELLIAIDKRDYLADVSAAQAGYLDAKQKYLQEKAKAKQATSDWFIDNTEQPNELVTRGPQLASAEAKLRSAEAGLKKAELNLARTDILAPYDGHTLQKGVSIGQVVGKNAVLGQIYAIDALEIRLPLKNEDLNFIDLPDANKRNEAQTNYAPVSIVSTLGKDEKWQADLLRTEGAIDQASQQLHVIVQIPEPFGVKNKGKRSLKIGQYVTAKFKGIELKNVAVVPNKVIYQDAYVYVIENRLLVRKPINIGWRNQEYAVVVSGLINNDMLVTTSLGDIEEGVEVNIFNADITQAKAAKGTAL